MRFRSLFGLSFGSWVYPGIFVEGQYLNFNFNLSPGGAMQMHVLITGQAPPLKRLIAIQWSASVGAAATAAATCITLHHWMQLLGIA